MTQAEKRKILHLRQIGYGCIKIAQEMGISSNTVKSFLRRNPSEDNSKSTLCEQCGQAIVTNDKGKGKRFCSDACRIKWWNHHTNLMKENTVCKHCGKSFHGRAGRKFCSHACYIAERFGGKNVP